MEVLKYIIIAVLLSGCAYDKALHVGASYAITNASYLYYSKNTDDHAEGASILTALGIGFIKELFDKKFDWNDIFADMFGIGLSRIK